MSSRKSRARLWASSLAKSAVVCPSIPGAPFAFPHLGKGSLQALLAEKLAVQAVPNFRFRFLLHLCPSIVQSSARDLQRGAGRLVGPRAIVRCLPLLLHFKRPRGPEPASAGYQAFGPASSRGLRSQSLLCLISFDRFSVSFTPSQACKLLTLLTSRQATAWSSRFCPPRRYRASQAETSSLLRAHLPPHTA